MADDPVIPDPQHTAEHAAAYHTFALIVKWVMVMAASLVSFFAIWFAVGAGFIAGIVVGLIIFAIGIYALRHGWAHSSEQGSLVYPQAH